MEPIPRGQRIAGLLKLWRVLDTFFLHLEFADIDWERMPHDWLPRVEAAESTVDYYDVLMQLAAHLNDSHIGIAHPAVMAVLARRGGSHIPPMRLQPVEDSAVIAAVYDGGVKAGLARGTEVTAIDGRPIAELAAERGAWMSASTPQARRQMAMALARLGPEGSVATLSVVDDAGARTVGVPRSMPYGSPPLPDTSEQPPEVRRVDGFGYMDLTRVATPEDARAALRSFLGTPGLVLDMRGYPRCGPQFSIVPHLIDRPCSSTLFEIPHRTPETALSDPADEAPFGVDSARLMHYVVHPDPDLHYGGPVAVLIDERAISSAEDFCIYLRNAGRATFVGSPTTGTNGDVTFVMLPGGGLMNFTGMRVRYADGARFQNLGILPDVEAHPTIAGLRAGRDEVLDAAIQTLRRLTAIP
jgi:C-terminal processing protease CtpA/Prc